MRLMPRIVMSLLIVILCSSLAQATSLIPTSLERMTEHAELIVIGVCQDRQTVAEAFPYGGHIPVTTYHFTVKEVLKNTTSEAVSTKQPFSFRQMGGKLPAGKKRAMLRGSGSVSYEEGREYMLFLIQRGGMSGPLWEPVGLMQGAFTVERSASGDVTVMNGNKNRYLFPDAAVPGASGSSVSKGTAVIAPAANGAVSLGTVRAVVEKHAKPQEGR